MLKKIKLFLMIASILILLKYSNSITVKCKNVTLDIEISEKYANYTCDFLEGNYVKNISPDIAIDLIRSVSRALVEKKMIGNFSRNLMKVFYEYAKNLMDFCYKDEDCLGIGSRCISKIYLDKVGGRYFKSFGEKCFCFKNRCLDFNSLHKVTYFRCKDIPVKFIKCVMNFSSKFCISNESERTLCDIVRGEFVSSDKIWNIILEYSKMKEISTKEEIREIEKIEKFLYENLENTHCFVCGGEECREGETKFIINLPNFTLPKCICKDNTWICVDLKKDQEKYLRNLYFSSMDEVNCNYIKAYFEKLIDLNILNEMRSLRLKEKTKEVIIYLADVCNLIKVIEDRACIKVDGKDYECFEENIDCNDYSSKKNIIICYNKLKESMKKRIKIKDFENHCEVIRSIVKNSNNLMEIISAMKALEDMRVDPYKVLEGCSLVDIKNAEETILYVLLYEEGLEELLEIEGKKKKLQYSKNIRKNILHKMLGKSKYIEIPREIPAKISNVGILTVKNISLISVERVKVGNKEIFLKNPEEIRIVYDRSTAISIKNISLDIRKERIYLDGKIPLDSLVRKIYSKLSGVKKVWIDKSKGNFYIHVARVEQRKVLGVLPISCYKKELYNENLSKIEERYDGFVCNFLIRIGILK